MARLTAARIREAHYDVEIAPLLLKAVERCEVLGMIIMAIIGYAREHGHRSIYLERLGVPLKAQPKPVDGESR